MINKSLISVITPLYNSENYIYKTINSVRSQTYKNWEMIVVNDCSSDNGPNIVKNFINEDSRIKLVNLNKNSGPAVARNKAIELADGDFIAFLDSDDYWNKYKLEKQINIMLRNEYDITCTWFQHVDKNNNKGRIIKAPSTINYKKILLTNYMGCSTVMVNIKSIGKYYIPNIRKRQDYGLWLKMLKDGNTVYCIDKVLTYYRVGNRSVSSNKIKMVKYNWNLYRDIENYSIIKSLYCLAGDIIFKVFNLK